MVWSFCSFSSSAWSLTLTILSFLEVIKTWQTSKAVAASLYHCRAQPHKTSSGQGDFWTNKWNGPLSLVIYKQAASPYDKEIVLSRAYTQYVCLCPLKLHLVNSILHQWSSLAQREQERRFILDPTQLLLDFDFTYQQKLEVKPRAPRWVCLVGLGRVGLLAFFFPLTNQPNICESSQPTYRKDHHGHQSSTLESGELQCWQLWKQFDPSRRAGLITSCLSGREHPSFQDLELVGNYQDRHCTGQP